MKRLEKKFSTLQRRQVVAFIASHVQTREVYLIEALEGKITHVDVGLV